MRFGFLFGARSRRRGRGRIPVSGGCAVSGFGGFGGVRQNGGGRRKEGGENSYVFDVGFAHEAFFRDVEVYGEKTAHGFHEGDALVLGEGAFLEVFDERVRVEVVDVRWCLEMWGFVLVAFSQ